MRQSGILMHISSLPNNYGIGTMGKEAYNFVDFLKKSGQGFWQILPLGHTSYGDSPYQCFSAFAGNPYFIDLDILKEKNLLKLEDYINEDYGENKKYVDYEKIFYIKNKILKKAYLNFKQSEEFERFKLDNSFWLQDYSMYMALKEKFNLMEWNKWDTKIKKREKIELLEYKELLKEEIEYYNFLQYEFFHQWGNLKNYANKKGIKIIGDIPIYVASDSADVWSNPYMFKLDENLNPKVVAGCPPDAFSATGQLWGNPIYNWEEMKKDNYNWWIKRIKENLRLYDIIRIDHFRGFESFWEIPYGDKTAINGKWIKGPGIELFNKVKEELGDIAVIAEDLGILTDDVIEMLKKSKFPGMKVLQFAFSGSNNPYLPHNYEKNCIAYAGTHDNATIKEWFESCSQEEKEKAIKYLNLKEDYIYGFLRGIWASVSDLAIGTMQDFLQLGKEARMNTPATLGGNWCWRVEQEALTDEVAKKIYDLTKLYDRTQ